MGVFAPILIGIVVLDLQAQTNFYQYLPAILLALAFLEGNAVLAPIFLYSLGAIVTMARLSHCIQLFFGIETVPLSFRIAGMLTTCLFLLVASTLLILLGWQVPVFSFTNLMPCCQEVSWQR